MAAYAAYELERKREEELARQAAEEEHHAEMRAEARARAEVEWDRASSEKKAANFQKATQADMTQAEKLAAYQQTATYKNYQASMQAWGQEKKNESKAAQADMTQAEKLAVYQQTDQYKNNQASLQAYEQQKANEDFRKGERASIIFREPIELNWPVSLPVVSHYHQYQKDIPKTGDVECVTTSVVMAVNMMKDLIAYKSDQPYMFDAKVQDYITKMDDLGSSELPYRVPSDFPNIPVVNMPIAGWMHPVWQAPKALKQLDNELRAQYGCGFTVNQSSGNTLADIDKNLQDGNLVLVHGLWPVTDPKNLQYYLGGGPHSMGPIVAHDKNAKTVTILDPASPDSLHVMPEKEFLEWWNRQSILNLYTAPDTMTVLVADTFCAPTAPPSLSTPMPSNTTAATKGQDDIRK